MNYRQVESDADCACVLVDYIMAEDARFIAGHSRAEVLDVLNSLRFSLLDNPNWEQ